MSGSKEWAASISQVRPAQPEVNSATGGSFVPVASTPGSSTTDRSIERETDVLVVAVRPATGPTGTAPFESPTMPLTLPVPVAAAWVRVGSPAGSVHTVSVEDFSLHTLTSHEPAFAAETAGVVWLVAEASAPPARTPRPRPDRCCGRPRRSSPTWPGRCR